MPQAAAEPSVVLTVLDLVGIFVFALSGGLVAVRKELDIFGVLVLAAAWGMSARLGHHPPPPPRPHRRQPLPQRARRLPAAAHPLK